MNDILVRGWQNFLARPSGPLNFRFLLQPTIATVLAVRAGIKDAKAGRPAFFWSLLTDRAHRASAFHDAAKDVSKVFLLALVLDALYQTSVHRGIFALEAIFTSLILAVVPYLLLRGPINRLATWIRSRRPPRKVFGGG